MSRAWTQQRERGALFAIRWVHWLAVRFDRRALQPLLYLITLYFLLTGTTARRCSRLYLRRLLGREPRWRELFRQLFYFSSVVLDRGYLLEGQIWRFQIQVSNGELIDRQVASGQGCLLVGSHLGSFEILRVLGITERRFPVKILMDVAHNRGLTRYLDAINSEIAAAVIPIGRPDTLLRVKGCLERGYLIGALADRVMAEDKVVRCRFLGKDVAFPAGPWLLAAAMHCPVILFFGLFRGGNRYEVYFEHFADRIALQRGARQQGLQRCVQRYADRLEYYLRDAPYNWFNFYDFWADGVEAAVDE